MFFETVGHYTVGISKQAAERMTLFAAEEPELHVFADFSRMESYESASRTHATTWCREHLKALASVHVLSKPGIVAMGVATAAMTLSLIGLRLRPYTDRTRFLSEFEAAKQAARK